MSYDQIQKLIDMGNGFASKELGPPHDVYRISNNSSGNVIQDSNRIATGVKIFTKIAYGGGVRESLETEKNQGILWYKIIGDLRPFRVGDIFVVNDPHYGEGFSAPNFPVDEFKGFALADHSPIKKALGGHLNCNITIFRPSTVPSVDGQWDKTSRSANPVVLTAGEFALGDTDSIPAQIPAGLLALGRSYGDRVFTQVPAEHRKSGWELYVPVLKGFDVREGDKIVGPDGARYIVIIPYTKKVGATGSQWFLEREAAGA